MILFDPLQVIIKVFEETLREAEKQNATPDQNQKPVEPEASRFIRPLVEGLVLGATLQLAKQGLNSIRYFHPPTIKVCKSLPDLMIDPSVDPTGLLRDGMDLGLKVLLPGFPEVKICAEIPLPQVEEQIRGVMEFLLPALGDVPVVGDWLKDVGLIREVQLKRLPSNHHLVQELREHLKNQGVLKEIQLRQLPHTHPDVIRLREQTDNVNHRRP